MSRPNSFEQKVKFIRTLTSLTVRINSFQKRKTSLRSHGKDILPLSYRSDFWNGKVDCSHGSGPLSYQVWDLFTRGYAIVPFRCVSRKRNSDMPTNFKHCRIRSNFYLKFNKHEKKWRVLISNLSNGCLLIRTNK